MAATTADEIGCGELGWQPRAVDDRGRRAAGNGTRHTGAAGDAPHQDDRQAGAAGDKNGKTTIRDYGGDPPPDGK